ncbi:unnamed protein product [Angiostrongylus costaricensis]|uniref:AMP_N domain-containing protein n=1 Tax=Angiostrongylus costaricensis TaxID=334426 RepID=A0A0R3PZ37_ANGCS|nr:unnamed protein product [Angiostrongylus costaricensis]
MAVTCISSLVSYYYTVFISRYPYLRNLAIAIPSFSSLCKEEYRKVEHEVQARRFFKWSRFASSNNEDSMAPRGLHTMVYHEKECAMYVFGGEAPDWRLQGDSSGPASFNDLWRLDMASNFVFVVAFLRREFAL